VQLSAPSDVKKEKKKKKKGRKKVPPRPRVFLSASCPVTQEGKKGRKDRQEGKREGESAREEEGKEGRPLP